MTHEDLPYRIGDIVEGQITGIKAYGVFVKLDESQQGLIHISEADHGFVENLGERFKVGETIEVKIIDIDEYTHKLSLSVRALNALSTPDHPSRKNRPRRRRSPKIGFKSIDDQMPAWIEEGLQNINGVEEGDVDNESY